MKYGTRVGFTNTAKRTLWPNHPSIHNHMKVIDKYIENEISAGRIRDITDNLPAIFYCSPLSLSPKKRDGLQTGWRMIFDLSCLHGQSVNDGIPLAHYNMNHFNTPYTSCRPSGPKRSPPQKGSQNSLSASRHQFSGPQVSLRKSNALSCRQDSSQGCARAYIFIISPLSVCGG